MQKKKKRKEKRKVIKIRKTRSWNNDEEKIE